jgi:hypothetical protein
VDLFVWRHTGVTALLEHTLIQSSWYLTCSQCPSPESDTSGCSANDDLPKVSGQKISGLRRNLYSVSLSILHSTSCGKIVLAFRHSSATTYHEVLPRLSSFRASRNFEKFQRSADRNHGFPASGSSFLLCFFSQRTQKFVPLRL